MSGSLHDVTLKEAEFESAMSLLRAKLSDVTLTEKITPFPSLASTALMIYRLVFESDVELPHALKELTSCNMCLTYILFAEYECRNEMTDDSLAALISLSSELVTKMRQRFAEIEKLVQLQRKDPQTGNSIKRGLTTMTTGSVKDSQAAIDAVVAEKEVLKTFRNMLQKYVQRRYPAYTLLTMEGLTLTILRKLKEERSCLLSASDGKD